MSNSEGFYTMKGYALHAEGKITSAMEDYLEMIARIRQGGGAIRVSDLSKQLHVKASSVTKMVQQLADSELVYSEKYGDIYLTEKGHKLGNYLLYRHDVLHRFLCLLNQTKNELEQVEKIEHFLDDRTIRNLELLNKKLEKSQ